MRAKRLKDLLRTGDRVAVSNITGREASGVSVISQAYAGNIVGGWALGKGGRTLSASDQTQQTPSSRKKDIPVFADVAEMMKNLPPKKHPNKIVIYSPPGAVYGDVKEILSYAGDTVETIFIITEGVSVEVSAKIATLAAEKNIDVLGCNTLGVINVHDHVRVGAVGGNEPEESFRPGSATILSNSGNMVNTIASNLLTAGIGTRYGISTGKDALILTPMADLLKLVEADKKTQAAVLYVEPGGLYELKALELAKSGGFTKPIIVYVGGRNLDCQEVSLGHAGAVVEGAGSSAQAKADAFDEYFECEPFDPDRRYRRNDQLVESLKRGIRVRSLHDIPAAVQLVYRIHEWTRDFPLRGKMGLNPWFVDFFGQSKALPADLVVSEGKIPDPWASQVRKLTRRKLGATPATRSMKGRSNASFNDGKSPRIFGRDLTELMGKRTFAESLILYWTGEEPEYDFEARLVEMTLIAALTNGPGTISAQGAKLSASAGNDPHMGMIATLSAIGAFHGGNGSRAVKYLADVFRSTDVTDPYRSDHGLDLEKLARDHARKFKKIKTAAKDMGIDYERIPCLGHPVFNKAPINYDPRERAVSAAMEEMGVYNIFLDFYHHLAKALFEAEVARKIWAVNLDAVIACVWLGICWPKLRDRRITYQRARDLAFLGFALGRSAGGAAEFLDHRDFGQPMDARIPPAKDAPHPPAKPVEEKTA